MAKKISKKLEKSINKIHEIGNKLLNIDGHDGFKIDEIHFSNDTGRMVCRYVKENGKWVYKCFSN